MTDFLQERHPTWTARHVEHRTGIPADTVRKWMARGSAPNAVHLARMASSYGIDFLAAVFVEVTDVELAARQARADALEAESASIRRTITERRS